MKKSILIVLVFVFFAVLPSVFAVTGTLEAYQPYIPVSFIATANETATSLNNWTASGTAGLVGGRFSVDRTGGTNFLKYIHRLINVSENGGRNATLFEGNISIGSSTSDHDFIMSFHNSNDTADTSNQVFHLRARPGNIINLVGDGDGASAQDTVENWERDSTWQHLQIIAHPSGTDVIVTVRINGTEKARLTGASCTATTTPCQPISMLIGRGDAQISASINVSSFVSYNGTEYNNSGIVALDTPPELSLYNMTSEGGEGCINWRINKSNPCVTNDTTPTTYFVTNKNAFCGVGISNLNYTALGSSRNCTGGEGTTEHTCTIIPQDELTQPNSFIYLSCKDNNGNQNSTSSSGALALSIQAKETGAVQAIGTGIQNALLNGYINYTNQQISARDLNNNQFIGTFDRVARKGTKVWAFNYISSGESHVAGTFNLTPVLYVLQLMNTTQQQVTLEVERMINATK